MGLARDLVDLESLLRANRVDPFVSVERSGLLETPDADEVLSAIRRAGFSDAARVMLLCLQALRIQDDNMGPNLINAELVTTLPPEMPGLARATGQVMREMLRPPVDEVILLGYELSDPQMINLLVNASLHGANVIMICDRSRGSAQRILDRWPKAVRMPRVYQDSQREDATPYASMHAKCLLVDGVDLLITSANFTFHGLHGNVEIGVRLSGPPANEARQIFSYLVERRIVEETDSS